LQVDFLQPNGAVITNTVSDGPGMTESDYNMTYTFDWAYDMMASPRVARSTRSWNCNIGVVLRWRCIRVSKR
jgi:hypothetical protein